MISPLRFRPFLVATLCTLVVFQAQARQGEVRGFVTDASSEQTLQGATVVLQIDGSLVLGTATDGDGFFSFRRVSTGTYTLQVSFVGFETYTGSVSLRNGGTIERLIALDPSRSPIDEVVVEAEIDTGVTTVTAGLESLIPRQIERVPIPGVSGDLAGYLQTMPGVVVQGDRGGQFFVRGGAVDQNLALLDGLPVYMPFHVLSFYSAFPQEVVDRADVYTGGFGARYGGRVSSVIDVKARNGNKQDLAGSISVAPFLSTVQIDGPLVRNRISFLLSARQSLIEEIVPELFGQALPYRFGDRMAKIHALLGSGQSLSFTFLDTDDRGDIAGTKKTFEGDAIASAPTDSAEVAWSNTVYGGTYTLRSNALPLVLTLTAGRSEMSNEMGAENDPERTSSIKSTDLGGTLQWSGRRTNVAIGARYRASALAFRLDGLFDELSTDAEDLDELDAFAESSFDVSGSKIRFEPGVHIYSVTNQSRLELEPRIRFSFHPGGLRGTHHFHAAWGVYHQATLGLDDERDLGNLFTAWTAVKSDRALPTATHAILGWNARVSPAVSAAVEGFYKRYEGLSVPIFSAFPRFTTTLQSADGNAYGLDARIELTDRPFINESVLDGYVSYSYSNVEYDASGTSYHPAHDRRHQMNALFHAQRGEVGMTVQWQIGSGLPFTESGGFDTFILLNPDVDVSTEAGLDRILYADPFKGRQPTYSRMDVWLERRVDHGKYVATLRAGAINVLNRDNLFYYDLFTFKRVDQLPIIPSVGLKVELR